MLVASGVSRTSSSLGFIAYVHLKESHHDGKVILAPIKDNQSMAKLFNQVDVGTDSKNQTKDLCLARLPLCEKGFTIQTRSGIKV